MTQLTLSGRNALDVRVEESIRIMQAHEVPEGFHLAFSGGKDSIVLLALAKMAGVKFDPWYKMTTVDPPELVQHMRRHYPEVRWSRPRATMYKLIEEKGLPCRRTRWCCEEFKERPIAEEQGRIVMVGVRAAESRARRKALQQADNDNPIPQYLIPCGRFPGKRLMYPIRAWEDDEIWAFIRRQRLAYPALYDEGWRRLGCVMCPFERKVERSMARWPRIWENCRRAVHRGWAHPDRFKGAKRRFATPDALYEWWCLRDQSYPKALDDESQAVLDLASGAGD